MERIYVKYSQLLNSSLSFIFAMLEARATPCCLLAPGVSETRKANQERGENECGFLLDGSVQRLQTASESVNSIQRRPFDTEG